MNRIILTIFAGGIALICAYYCGYRAAMNTAKLKQAEAAAAFNKKAKDLNESTAIAINSALDERDKTLRALDAFKRDSERVRVKSEQLSARLARLSESRANSGGGDSERLGKCERLLSESAELLSSGIELAEEGTSLSVGISADKDVLKSAVDSFNDALTK